MAEYTSTLFRKLPKYLLTKQNQTTMVLFVSIFAIIFINIFKPFGSEEWMTKGKFTATQYLLWSTILVTMGMSIVAARIADGHAEVYVALAEAEFGMGDRLVFGCGHVAIRAAIAIDVDALNRGAFDHDLVILHVQFLELRRIIPSACTVEMSLLHGLDHLIVLQLLGSDEGGAAEGLSYAVAVVVVIIAHGADQVIHAVADHIVVDIGAILASRFQLRCIV